VSEPVRVDRSERRPFGLIAATFFVIAFAGWLMPAVQLPRLTLFSPVFLAIAILGNVATGLIVLAIGRAETARRSTIFLGCSFVATGVTLFLVVLFLRLLPGNPAIVSSAPGLAAWLFICWHVSVATGAFAYVFVRRFDDVPAANAYFGRWVCAGLVVFVVLVVLPVCVFVDRLPTLDTGTSTIGYERSLIGPACALLLLLATVALYRIRTPNSVERALAFSYFALTLSFVLFLVSGHRYTASFYLGRSFVAAGSLIVVVTAMRTLVAQRSRLGVVEWTLGQVASESAKRAGRIRAVSGMSSAAQSSEAERSSAVLLSATAAMRPGKPMLGMLTHQRGETIVVDATVWSEFADNGETLAHVIFPGAIYPVEQTMATQLRGHGRAMGWDDLAAGQRPNMVYTKDGMRSFIGSPIPCAGIPRFIAFISPATMADEPFAEDDFAYVDVVAAFFAARFNQQQQIERIAFQVEHDALTGLDNRATFLAAIGTELAGGAPFTIALIDLDGFRHVNDRYGHQIGDELLVEVATGLRRVGNGDLIARMSADEFGVVIRGAASREAAAASLQRYADLFAAPFPTGDRTGTQLVAVGASIGAARCPVDGAAVEEVLRRADLALDVAKERGGSVTLLFEQSMEAMLEATRLRTLEFSAAIANDQLALVYQPTFTLATRAITGAEALVRWNHPVRGLIGPEEFIPFAERTGLIAPLTMWVLAHVSLDIASVPELPPGFRIYFNVAAPMLDDVPFIAAVNAGLTKNSGLANHLGVEVTESAAMQNIDRSMRTIALFRSWGLPVAIDDFGTGHSSLTYLKRFTVDLVKIDKSFVNGLPSDERDGQVTEMLLHIVDRFGFATIAEGIENEAQADWLLAHGCRYGQGFFVAKPGSFAELLRRIGVQARPAAEPVTAIAAGGASWA
jgi:diguanylate cyclase (GGDEF)-like protein